jgi:hypothetical protein
MKTNFDLSDIIQNEEIMGIEDFSSKLILPEGPRKGFRFSPQDSVLAKHLWPYMFGEKKGNFNEFIITGPSQSGKSLVSFIIPSIYISYYQQENSILSSPTLTLIQKKFSQSIMEMILQNDFLRHRLLPHTYHDKLKNPPKMSYNNPTFRFNNGASVSFISTQSSDKGKSSETCRNIFITEFGGVKRVSTSDEADAIEQLRARARSFISVGYRFVLESTQTTPKGMVANRYAEGCQAEIVSKCPKCEQLISPKRENLIVDKMEPMNSYVECPLCEFQIRDDHRKEMINNTDIVFHGESNSIFSIQQGGFFNPFYSLHHLVNEEITCMNAKDYKKESKERELQNFVWGEPFEDEDRYELSIDSFLEDDDKMSQIISHQYYARQIPEWVQKITVGMDAHLKEQYYTVVGWRVEKDKIRGHIIEYGRYKTRFEDDKDNKSQDLIITEALHQTVQQLKEKYDNKINIFLADIGHMFQSMLARVGKWEKSDKLIGAIGLKGRKEDAYGGNTQKSTCHFIFEHGSYRKDKATKHNFIEHDSNQERKYLQDAIRTGELKLFKPDNPNDHEQFLKSIYSHSQVFHEQKGFSWEAIKGTTDHYLDSAILTMTGLKILDTSISFADPSEPFGNKKKKIKKPKNVINFDRNNNSNVSSNNNRGMKVVNREIRRR